MISATEARGRTLGAALGVCAAVWFTAAPAAAQDDTKAAATAAFDQAEQLKSSGKLADACCPAAKPACSNGLCASATLSCCIVTVSNGVLATSSVHLVEHGLEYTQTVCGTVSGQKVCINGGIRP